jgi:hypothetical protein
MTCELCAPFLKMADEAERLAEMPDHEYAADDMETELRRLYRSRHGDLERHAFVLLETMRPYPVRNSLPKFVEAERHFGRVTFELDLRQDQFREDEQVQLWAPTWVKVVTDYASDLRLDCGSPEMADAIDFCRNEILLRGLREDAWFAYAIDSAFRLGGRDAAVPFFDFPTDPLDHTRRSRRATRAPSAQRA